MRTRIKNKLGVTKVVLDSLARTMLPTIRKYFETEEGKKTFENWKQEQLNKKPSAK